MSYSPSSREGAFSEAHIQEAATLCVRTGAKPSFGPARHRTLPQDVVVPNKDAGLALYPTWLMSYAADRMRHDADRTTDRMLRLTVPEAAGAMGISAEAVRQRIKRGTLTTEKDASGTVYSEERTANRENRRLLAAALERIPAIEEAPSEPRDAPETGSDLRPGVETL
jgi:hypothetical protein